MTKTIDPERLEKLLAYAREIVDLWYKKGISPGCPDWPCNVEPYSVGVARFMIESYEEIQKRKGLLGK